MSDFQQRVSETALKTCESQRGFWKAIAYAAVGCLVGFLGGAAPIAWRDLATTRYVDTRAPWAMDRPLVISRIERSETLSESNAAALEAVRSTLNRMDGNLQTLLQITANPPMK